ncbi:hypothetical protein [Krasilnikovia sp. MM14-A1259]|uniref:hypothetical protein n=1 Tax=Krasilnikovia sp. MM14-A1259 TaxID=3373539 RepID=UPI00399C9500
MYKPDGQAERRWHVRLGRLPLPEMKMIQHAAGVKFGQFQQGLMAGGVDELQALLWVYLRREHPTLRVEDVKFVLDEVQLQQDKDEIAEEIRVLEEDLPDLDPAERAAGLAMLRVQLRDAPDAPGKAPEAASTPAVPAPPAETPVVLPPVVAPAGPGADPMTAGAPAAATTPAPGL